MRHERLTRAVSPLSDRTSSGDSGATSTQATSPQACRYRAEGANVSSALTQNS